MRCAAMTISLGPAINIEIRTDEEREVAMNLVQKLSGALEVTPEESRLLMLIEAIEAWDLKRDQQQTAEQSAERSDVLLPLPISSQPSPTGSPRETQEIE